MLPLDQTDKDDLSSIFQQQSAAHKQARESFLENAIKTTREWIGRMNDPELGAIGEMFLDETLKSGCKQEIDIFFNNGLAEYCSFSFKRGFVNMITYGPGAEESLARLFSAMVHETSHALQKMKAAALHASPFNPDTQIIVCPRDWVMLEERCEQDSYTKQAVFNSLLAKFLPEVHDTSKFDPLSVDDFDKIRAAAGNIGDALVQAARTVLTKSFYSDNPDAVYRFKNSIQDQALKNYDAGIAKRKSSGERNWTFVRLEPEDIAAIGASCGPNIFGQNGVLPEFLQRPALLQKSQEKLAEIDKTCGITNVDDLPTLSEALKKIGMTREQFIAQAYKKKIPPPTEGSGPSP